MQDFSTEFFILWEDMAGSYLVSNSLTSHHFVYLQMCIIGITSLLAYMYHCDTTTMMECTEN